MKKFLLFALIISSVLGVFGQKKTASTKNTKKDAPKASVVSPVSSEEYLVYVVILGKPDGSFVIRDKTSASDSDDAENGASLNAKFKGITPDTIEDFKAKNKKSAPLEKKFPAKGTFNLITDEELKVFFDKRLNWEGFYKTYPNSGGLTTFSRVGFSKDGAQALVFVAHSCGGLCGEGNYYFLQKENDVWKIISKNMTWVS